MSSDVADVVDPDDVLVDYLIALYFRDARGLHPNPEWVEIRRTAEGLFPDFDVKT